MNKTPILLSRLPDVERGRHPDQIPDLRDRIGAVREQLAPDVLPAGRLDDVIAVDVVWWALGCRTGPLDRDVGGEGRGPRRDGPVRWRHRNLCVAVEGGV